MDSAGIKIKEREWGADEIRVNVYSCHGHGHVKGSNASNPWEWQGFPPGQAHRNGKRHITRDDCKQKLLLYRDLLPILANLLPPHSFVYSKPTSSLTGIQ